MAIKIIMILCKNKDLQTIILKKLYYLIVIIEKLNMGTGILLFAYCMFTIFEAFIIWFLKKQNIVAHDTF
jgi:hypothetical protein